MAICSCPGENARSWGALGEARPGQSSLSAGALRYRLVLAQGGPIFHSGCEGELGVALESLQGPTRDQSHAPALEAWSPNHCHAGGFQHRF